MNLNARERQALRSIEGGLTQSDPALVAKLAAITGLMAHEERPAAERSRVGWPQAVVGSLARQRPGSRGRRHARRRSTWASALMAFWLAMACALIATAAALSHDVAANGQCPAVAVACGSQPASGHAQHGSG
jgi:hypothetical protein